MGDNVGEKIRSMRYKYTNWNNENNTSLILNIKKKRLEIGPRASKLLNIRANVCVLLWGVKGPLCSYFPPCSCLFFALDPLGSGRVRGRVGLSRARLDRIHSRSQKQPRTKPGGCVGLTWWTGEFSYYYYHITLSAQCHFFFSPCWTPELTPAFFILKIFYRVLREIPAGEELSVWYSNALAQWYDIPTTATPTHDEKGKLWSDLKWTDVEHWALMIMIKHSKMVHNLWAFSSLNFCCWIIMINFGRWHWQTSTRWGLHHCAVKWLPIPVMSPLSLRDGNRLHVAFSPGRRSIYLFCHLWIYFTRNQKKKAQFIH